MVIVIVHWKIHRNAKARQDFFAHWKNVLKIDDRRGLVGEYLSEPLAPDKADFPCSIFNVPASTKYDSYFNVGIWESAAVFKDEIIDPYVGRDPKTESFEYEFRDRMLLNPLSLRAGSSSLPPIDRYYESP